MKIRYGIIGALALAFGLINIFWYTPYSFALVFMNQPFPFPHLQNVELLHGGIGTQVSSIPLENAIADPYWLAWSLSLYSGILILSALGIKSIMQNI